MKIRNENRNNLVSGVLEGATSSTIEKLNEANKNIPSLKIQYERKMGLKLTGKSN